MTFDIEDQSAAMHGLAIVNAPATGQRRDDDETTCPARGGNGAAGATETVTAQLEPGEYEPVCFLAGHYVAGQKLKLTVE